MHGINGSSLDTLGVIARHRIEPLPAPKVTVQETTLDQMAQSALSRIQYGIEAECDWAAKKIKDGFKEDRHRLDTRSRIGTLPVRYFSEKASVWLLQDPIESIIEVNSCDELPVEGNPRAIYVVYASTPAFFRCWNKNQYIDVTYSFPNTARNNGAIETDSPTGVAFINNHGKIPSDLFHSYF